MFRECATPDWARSRQADREHPKSGGGGGDSDGDDDDDGDDDGDDDVDEDEDDNGGEIDAGANALFLHMQAAQNEEAARMKELPGHQQGGR